MNTTDAYKQSIHKYAEWEYAILYAATRNQITKDENRQARTIAYLAHGYLEAARKASP